MAKTTPTVRIGIIGHDPYSSKQHHGCALWNAGYSACLEEAEAIPVPLTDLKSRDWDRLLGEVHGVMIVDHEQQETLDVLATESLLRWCRDHELPLLAVDCGLGVLATAFNGSVYDNVGQEVAEAIQHRHPPEPGLRHAIEVTEGSRLSKIYGDGEIIVNSEHRRAIRKVPRGFMVSARALDGVVEAVEAMDEDWFALGVQWHPASPTASGLDIQLFRALVDAGQKRFAMSEEANAYAAA